MHEGRPTRLAGASLLTAVALVLTVSACGSDPDPQAGPSTAADPSTAAAATTEPTSEPATEPTTEPTSEPAAEPTETQPALPACDDVWVAGERLPPRYTGCTSSSGAQVRPERFPCSYGGAILTHERRFYALPGRPVNEVPDRASSPDFQQALSACQA